MNTKNLHKTLTCVAAILTALVTLTAPEKAQAQGVTAFLVNCTSTTSVTGQFMYVGRYSYSGREYTFSFKTYCPATIQLQ